MDFLKQIVATLIGIIIAGILFFLGTIFFIGILVTSISKEKPITVSSNSILMLTLDRPIRDRAPQDPFSSIDIAGLSAKREFGLNEILQCIEKAKDDKNIKGIYLKLSSINAGIATVDEIRNAILDFKKSEKFVIAYSDLYTQKAYFLATAADKIYMNPEGNFIFSGLNTEIIFLKGMLDKLGVDAQILRHGKYKSAVEPYEEKKMSPESRGQITVYLNVIWNHMLDKISESRNIEKNLLMQYAEQLMIKTAAEACQYKLIDSALYKDELIHELSVLSGTDDDDLKLTTLVNYAKTLQVKNSSDKIAVIYAQGIINMAGEMDEDNISAEKLAYAIREARKDSDIKAIVFRVNSPGGGALASEIIWRELSLASKTKPVIASMGDVAASGGYYILAPSTTVLSSPVTITGSIGVYGVILNAKDFLNNKLGITTDNVKTNKHADMLSMTHPLTAEEKVIMQLEIDRVYNTFMSHVADGRGKTKKEIDEIAQGRVWAGKDAQTIGLTDSIGGLNKAIAIAAEKAGLTDYSIEELPNLEDKWMRWIGELTGESHSRLLKNELKDFYPFYKNLINLKQYKGIQMRLPYLLEVY